MRKKALIVLAEGFEEIEAITTIDILRRGGIEVTIASLKEKHVKGSRNIEVIADTTIDRIALDYDAIILPGAMPGAENLSASKEVSSLIIEMNNKKKIIAAICATPAIVLAPLGILDNKTATCYPSMETNFNTRTTYKEDAVVIDENIITSRGPATAMEFAFTLVKVLSGERLASLIKSATLAG